jgi:N-acetyl-anhydromuramyl-L-alanine amidase AmpD
MGGDKMTVLDVADAAAKLRVISIFQPNSTGVVTLPSKYNQIVPKPYDRFVRHVTVGSDSLKWLAGPGTEACIPYLVPTKASDPFPDNWTVFKMIPDSARCWHVGDTEWNGTDETYWHPRSMGHEIENLGDFKHPIEDRQYIKSALVYAHDCAVWKWLDRMVFDHSTIAINHTAAGGRRTDPQAGLFDEGIWWQYIYAIRAAWPWTDVARWDGH